MSHSNTASSAIGKLRYSCSFPICKNRYYSPIFITRYINKSFHHCPKDSETSVKRKYICNVPTEYDNRFYICEDYFVPSDYVCATDSKYLLPKSYPKALSKNTELTLPNQIPDISDIAISHLQDPCLQNQQNIVNSNEAVLKSDIDAVNNNQTYASFHQTNSLISKLPDHSDKYSFLLEKRSGILSQIGL